MSTYITETGTALIVLMTQLKFMNITEENSYYDR